MPLIKTDTFPVIKTKVLGVTAVYADNNVQHTLKHMDKHPKDYLVYVRDRKVYALRDRDMIFLGTVKEEYQPEFDKCKEPYVKQWYITGGPSKGIFHYGMNLELEMRDINDVKPNDSESAPF